MLGAVQERTKHLRVVIIAREAIESWYVIGCGFTKVRDETRTFTGGDHPESQRAGPFIQFDGQGGFVTIGHTVHHSGRIGLLFQ